MQPRYQIFVSSTFRDLTAERQAVLDAILGLNHFPAGMEVFPAANSTPWELITKIISESDYYVLIIGGRYGSVDENGVSYTEKEYDLAVKLKKPVLAFVHADPGKIAVEKSEEKLKAQRKLEKFRTKVKRHHIKPWNNAEDLKSNVIVGLVHLFNAFPADGWVKASGINNPELMTKLVKLQQRHDELQSENLVLKEKLSEAAPANIAQGNSVVSFELMISVESGARQIKCSTTWDEIFFGIAESLVNPCPEWMLERSLFGFLEEKISKQKEEWIQNKISRQSQIRSSKPFAIGVVRQFFVLNLVDSFHKSRGENREIYWHLTKEGKEKYFTHTAFHSAIT
jgi:hypothetical protein